jgi:hypothetical protein
MRDGMNLATLVSKQTNQTSQLKCQEGCTNHSHSTTRAASNKITWNTVHPFGRSSEETHTHVILGAR